MRMLHTYNIKYIGRGHETNGHRTAPRAAPRACQVLTGYTTMMLTVLILAFIFIILYYFTKQRLDIKIYVGII